MNLDQDTYDLIDQYLQNELPEHHPFFQQLREDTALAEEVSVRKSLSDAVVDYRLRSVEQLIASKRTKFKRQNSFTRKWGYGLLAVFLLSMAIVAYFYLPSTKREKTDLPQKSTGSSGRSLIQERVPASKTEPTFLPKKQFLQKEAAPKEISLKASLPAISAAPSVLPNEPSPPSPVSMPEPGQQPEQLHVEKEEPAKIPISPCAEVKIKAFIESGRPCTGSSEGQLRIKDVRGGKAPYQFSLDGSPFQEEDKFEGLKAGDYDIQVKDANGCVTLVFGKYPLPSKSCARFSEHVFNPNFGPWEVPNHHEKPGELTIFDKNGHKVYFRSFEKTEKVYWPGTQNNGDLLVPDVYIYNLNYSDAVIEQGRITITY